MSEPDSSAARSEAHDALREQLLRGFESYLDEALAGPELPPGLVQEGLAQELLNPQADLGPALGSGSDLYSVWAALTALAQEVKLQSRSFKQLADRIAPLEKDAELLSRTAAALQDVVASETRRARERAERAHLELLLDLRERLLRGRDAAHAQLDAHAQGRGQRRRFFARRAPPPDAALRSATEALAAGYALSLAEIEDALARGGVAEIECAGRAFDPHQMQAVALEQSAEPQGTVLEVYRSGFECNGEVLRTAQVKVSHAGAIPQS